MCAHTSVAGPEPEPEREAPESYHFATIRTGTMIMLQVLVPAPVLGLNNSLIWVGYINFKRNKSRTNYSVLVKINISL